MQQTPADDKQAKLADTQAAIVASQAAFVDTQTMLAASMTLDFLPESLQGNGTIFSAAPVCGFIC